MGSYVDLTGNRYGRLLVLWRGDNSKNGATRFACQCDCGNVTTVYATHLIRGNTKSCGCGKRKRPTIIAGDRFGRLIVQGVASNNPAGRTRYICMCDCGNVVNVDSGHLHSGDTQSCGCYKRNLSADRLYKHGGVGTDLYATWVNMKQRCFNPRSTHYSDYGGRGISVYPLWENDFALFREYVSTLDGFNEQQVTLDRINNDKGYEPGNIRWANAKTQGNNRRNNRHITHDGRTLTIAEWAEETGIKASIISSRIRAGWSNDRALTDPPKNEVSI